MAAVLPNPLIAPILPTEISYASPRLPRRAPSFFAPAPPARRCRSEGSSSDESPVPTPEGFIETDLRAGGPRLCESPCQTVAYYKRLRGPDTFKILTRLGDICRQHNAHHTQMNFCGRRSLYEPTKDPILTLLVIVKNDGPVQSGWLRLALRLWHVLRGEGIQASVEMVDPRFGRKPRIHPCMPSDAIFPIWRKIGSKIFHAIDRRGVFTISCFRVGHDDDRRQCPPTVIVGVDRTVHRKWKALREAVVAVLDANNLGTVAVIIRKDNQITRMGESVERGVEPSDCRRDPRIGTSLCPAADRDSQGTFGGWVELRNPKSGDWVPFAITCAHCCFPPEKGLSAADLQAVKQWKANGVPAADPAHAAQKDRLLEIDAPSFRDMKIALDRHAKSIANLHADSDYREVEALKEEGAFIMPLKERAWKNICKLIREVEKKREPTNDFFLRRAYRFGTVFAASGLREVTSTDDPTKISMRDWALLQPRGHRLVGKNIITSSEADIPDQLDDFKFNLPEIDEPLYKVGHPTGLTRGTYGNLDSCHVAKRVVNGKEVDLETWEHTIVWPNHLVVQGGDSGSLVFGASGFVVGMIFGGAGSEDTGYFTATRDLVPDIQRITGASEVRLRPS
ncbi:hypothetical protein BDW62DRAFT_218972 [Aspergillus aurantiobrunneus]